MINIDQPRGESLSNWSNTQSLMMILWITTINLILLFQIMRMKCKTLSVLTQELNQKLEKWQVKEYLDPMLERSSNLKTIEIKKWPPSHGLIIHQIK